MNPIKAGQSWGEPCEPPARTVHSAAAALRRWASDATPVGLINPGNLGDLWMQLGIPPGVPDDLLSANWMLYLLDYLVIELRDSPGSPWNEFQSLLGVEVGSRLSARSWNRRKRFEVQLFGSRTKSAFRGWSVAILNSAFAQGRQVNPGSHLNDGRIECLQFDVPRAQSGELQKRMQSGSHLPHPHIRRVRGTEFELNLNKPKKVWLDDQLVGRASHIRVSVAAAPIALCIPTRWSNPSAPKRR